MTSCPPRFNLAFDLPPWRLSGVVYAALLNDSRQLAALGDAVNQPPHKAAPRAPVLALRPRNTLALGGAAVQLPDDAPALQVGANLGIVIARTACRVPAATALQWVAGYTLVTDLCVPHASHYRPAVRHQARDGFCLIGPEVTPAGAVPDPDALEVRIDIDGRTVHTSSTARRVRSVAALLADVTEFMTLQAGDLLLLGPADGAPLVHAGQTVVVTIAHVGQQHSRYLAPSPAASTTTTATTTEGAA